MNILITHCELAYPHGSQIWTLAVSRELAKRGHSVHVLSPMTGPFYDSLMSEFSLMRDGTVNVDRFDMMLFQHPAIILGSQCWDLVKDRLPDPEHVIEISHGVIDAEAPVVGDGLAKIKFACVSEEIARKYEPIAWNVIRQPIESAWFELKIRPAIDFPRRILWASHRHPLPIVLEELCFANGIEVYRIGNIPIYPEQVREVYAQVDLVFGTGRWIYEAMAAGIPCVVADSINTLGYVTPANAESFQECNMTLRHRNAAPANWLDLMQHHRHQLGPMMKEWAVKNYRVEKIVDDLFRIASIPTMGDAIEKAFS